MFCTSPTKRLVRTTPFVSFAFPRLKKRVPVFSPPLRLHRTRARRDLDDTPRRAMAPPLTVVLDEKGAREWKPAEYEDEPTYSHLVEIAKTGRADAAGAFATRLASATPKTPFRQIWRAVYRKMRVAASDPPSRPTSPALRSAGVASSSRKTPFAWACPSSGAEASTAGSPRGSTRRVCACPTCLARNSRRRFTG